MDATAGDRAPYREQPLDATVLDHLFCSSAEQMAQIPDSAVPFISPNNLTTVASLNQ